MDNELAFSSTQLKVLSHHQYVTPDHITPATVAPNPFEQFRDWFQLAVECDRIEEAGAVSLATATPTAIPSVRTVLFKQLDPRGFVFFTNYSSRKARELQANPHAALNFYWHELHRAVRVVGAVEMVSQAESAEYFSTRPRGSQLGAWASHQSSVVTEDEVNDRLKEIEKRFATDVGDPLEVPCPEFWGGWRVIPHEIEFWSGKPSRLHDRIRYLRIEGSTDDNPHWKIDRLSP